MENKSNLANAYAEIVVTKVMNEQAEQFQSIIETLEGIKNPDKETKKELIKLHAVLDGILKESFIVDIKNKLVIELQEKLTEEEINLAYSLESLTCRLKLVTEPFNSYVENAMNGIVEKAMRDSEQGVLEA